jgi:AcrR family transcriptional regulator
LPASDDQSRDQSRPAPRRLPRGRHGLPRAFVVQNQRERIFDSLAAVCAEKGYPATTVEDVTARAGVSRRTFYDLFTGKEDCFAATYDTVVERLIGKADEAFSTGEPGWPRRLVAALRAVIELLGAEPALARLVIVEVLAAGRRALEHRDAALARLAVYFEAGRSELPAGMENQDLLAQAVIGGLYEALYSSILEGQAEHLPLLLPDLVYCALVPYTGHAAALGAGETERLRSGSS